MHALLSIHSLNSLQDERMVQRSQALVSLSNAEILADVCP